MVASTTQHWVLTTQPDDDVGERTTTMTMTLLCQRGWLEARSKRMPMTLSGKMKKKKTEKRHERSKHLNRRMTTSESSMNKLTAAESVVDLRHLVEYLFELLLLLLPPPLRLQLPVVFVYGAQLQ